MGAGALPVSDQGLFPAEHRSLRELYAMARQLGGHWGRLVDKLDPAPDVLERGVAASKQLLAELADRTAAYGLHGVPAATGAGVWTSRLRVAPEQTTWLEQACDEVNADLPKLRSFVLPGGTPAAAQLHVCRTVCRRAERRTIDCGDDVNPECVRYLNRLSDLLFILSRGANEGAEPLWEPGRYR